MGRKPRTGHKSERPKGEAEDPEAGPEHHLSGRTHRIAWVATAVLFTLTLGLEFTGASGVTVFAFAGLTILPLAYFMGVATEELAKRMGPGKGGFLNATFGNATELIIAFFALEAGLYEVVKASITGSIIGNILLVLGLSMLVGGVKHREQKFASRAAGTSSVMLTTAVVAMAIPSLALWLYGGDGEVTSDIEGLSMWTAVILIFVYVAGLLFSLHTHKDIFNPVGETEEPVWSRKKAGAVLLLTTLMVAVMSEVLVGGIGEATEELGMNELFMGVILIALIGNAAEHGSAVLMAYKNKMDLSVGIANSSGTQIALFVAPVLVLASFGMGDPMTLAFEPFELLAIAFSVAVVHMVSSDGESNWFEGFLLVAVYAILGIGFWFHP